MKNVYLLEQYDVWFSNSSRVLFGIYTSKRKALKAMSQVTDDFEKNFFENGVNQWVSSILEIGLMIREVYLNEFGEI